MYYNVMYCNAMYYNVIYCNVMYYNVMYCIVLHIQVRERRGSDVSDIFLSPEAYKATQAVEFIAEHLRNEDEYVQIREDWKYVAMVVDRAQLWLFFPRHND